ncbi:MAG TPA: FlgD immunoglobulin-like domain containing protein [Methanocella sp.]|nr:FlgD immunoglobulin-like domain containing protein [Methanocella sp.]
MPDLANASATLQITDADGGLVRALLSGNVSPGNSEIGWDARDQDGALVPDGTYTATLCVTNATDSVTRTASLTVDSVAPETTISFSRAPRADGSYVPGVTFSLAGTDAGSGICSYNYNLNDHGWNAWCSPVALNDGGRYTNKYKAIDCAGNYEIQTITVDVRADATPTPAPTPVPPAPTPAPEPAITPTPAATPSPVPDSRTFDINPQSVQVHPDGRISYATEDVTSVLAGRSVSGAVDVNLTRVPSAAGLNVYLRAGPQATEATQFKLVVTGSGGEIREFAGVMVVDHPALANGADIASARVTMKVTKAWVEEHGGADAIKILRYSDGVVEALDTRCAGTEGEMLVFEAFSPHGLSEFALAAVTGTAAVAVGGNAAGLPPVAWPSTSSLAIMLAIIGCGITLYVALRLEKEANVPGAEELVKKR